MSERTKRDDDLEPDKIPLELVRVQNVPDETTGTLLVDFLRDQGIDAALQPVEISMLPGVESMSHGYWGHIEVLERDAERARSLIRDYLASKPRTSTRRRAAGESGASSGDHGSGSGTDPEDAA